MKWEEDKFLNSFPQSKSGVTPADDDAWTLGCLLLSKTEENVGWAKAHAWENKPQSMKLLLRCWEFHLAQFTAFQKAK